MGKSLFTRNDFVQKFFDGMSYLNRSLLSFMTSVKESSNKILAQLPNKGRIFELAKAHTVGIAVGTRAFFSSKPVLMGMGAGLLGATIASIFLAPIAPFMLYFYFAKVAVISGTAFGLGSTLIQGLSNFFSSMIQARSFKAGQNVDTGYLPLPAKLSMDYSTKEHGPLVQAIHQGSQAANKTIAKSSKVHALYIPGDRVKVDNIVSLTERIVDGDYEVISSLLDNGKCN